MEPKKKEEPAAPEPDAQPQPQPQDRPELHQAPHTEEAPSTRLAEETAAAFPFAGGMLQSLAGNWWLVALRGALAVLFGILCFVWPAVSVVVLVFLFGAYAFIDGAMAIGAALSPADKGRAGSLVVLGILGLIAGIVAFLWPGITAVALLFLIGAWAIVKGVVEIVGAIRLRKEIQGEWLAALAGVFSIVFGAILLANPGVGAVALIWLIGAYAIVFGITMLVLGFKLRGVKEHVVQ